MVEIAKPKNYQIKSFGDRKKVEEEACEFVIPYFQKQYWDNFIDVRMNEEYFAEDIDFFVNGNSLELKANSKIIVNFLFEMKEELNGVRKDWNFLTSQAEYWLITDNEKKIGWLFKLKELRMAVLKIVKTPELQNIKRKLYKLQDTGKSRRFYNVSVNRDYLISQLEYCKRIDFSVDFIS